MLEAIETYLVHPDADVRHSAVLLMPALALPGHPGISVLQLGFQGLDRPYKDIKDHLNWHKLTKKPKDSSIFNCIFKL